MRGTLAIALLAFLTPLSHGQARGASITFGALPHIPVSHPLPIFLGPPFLYSDYGMQPAVVQAPPQVVVVPAPTVAAEPTEPAKPEPLLIEWRGERYVRVTNSNAQQADYAEPGGARRMPEISQHEAPPAVLVFRGGRREETAGYTITNGTMYVNADYSTTGSWTRRVRLADLDLPATLAANRERGVRFMLPAGPNEVVTRP